MQKENATIANSRLHILIETAQKITITRGNITNDDLKSFYDEGFSPENVLEIIVAVSLKTLSNYINHLKENTINDALQPFAVGEEIND